jgi:hypothetical protein
MALAGVHIAFGSLRISAGGALLFSADLSQTMASPATSSANPDTGTSVLSISASAPIFYAVGPTPDATNGPRRYMDPAFGREDVFVNPGDKMAWILA